MRPLAVLALTLTGCASMHGPLDVITPDELTIGRGSMSSALSGGYNGHQPGYDFEGESESNFAALTWDIPSFQDPNLTRHERRKIRDENYARDMALAAALSEEEPLLETIREAPAWLPWAMGGSLALLLLVAGLYSRRQPEW